MDRNTVHVSLCSLVCSEDKHTHQCVTYMADNFKVFSFKREDVLEAKQKGHENLSQLLKSAKNSGDLVYPSL